MTWLLNHVPWWAWGAASAAVLAFTWPLLPRGARLALTGLAALAVAAIAGRNAGSRSERERQQKQNEKAEETRRKIDASPRNTDPRERDRWMRD